MHAAAQAAGAVFHTLADAERRRLAKRAAPVYEKWGEKVGRDYPQKVRTRLGP